MSTQGQWRGEVDGVWYGPVTSDGTVNLSATLTGFGDVNATLAESGESNEIQPIGGYNPRKHGKDSYWARLLSSPVARHIESLPDEVAQVIETEAVQKFEQPKLSKAQAERDMRASLDSLGFAYRAAYKEIYLELVAEMHQQQEDEQIAAIVAALL